MKPFRVFRFFRGTHTGLIFALLLIVLVGGGFWWLDASRSTAKGPAAILDEAIERSSEFLIRQCKKDGQFVYWINLDPELSPAPRYNIVRHAGTVYSLAMSHQHRPSREKRDAVLRAVEFLKREAMAPVPGHEDLTAVWSRPEMNQVDTPVNCKLGGAGLGLVALVSTEEIATGTTSLDELRSLGRFLVFMQASDGNFYSKYDPARGGRRELGCSLYYPGEVALGLVMLYEKDPNPLWLETAAKGIAYLARRRAGKREVEADHWVLLATARLLPLFDECPDPPLSREEVLQHARQICQSMLAAKPDWPENALEHGCFTDGGRTCPTATRVEGLMAALHFLPEEDAELRKRITQAVSDAVAFLLRSQVREGRHAGAIPRMVRPLPKDHPRYKASSHDRMTEVRIDYVQHAMSGMIEYDRRFHQADGGAVKGE